MVEVQTRCRRRSRSGSSRSPVVAAVLLNRDSKTKTKMKFESRHDIWVVDICVKTLSRLVYISSAMSQVEVDEVVVAGKATDCRSREELEVVVSSRCVRGVDGVSSRGGETARGD